MAEDRYQRPRGRRSTERRQSRESVPADPGGFYDDPWPDDDDDDGSAGVREPRRPKPFGPVSAAGERPEPEPPVYLTLSDARYEEPARD